jgi:predicted AlkP superfamily pyrophosphatase or phosphodiesterase
LKTAGAAARKLVWVLADGLRADTAAAAMGYLQALNEAGRARWATLQCELPGLSRPLYATLISGRAPVEHGIVSNQQDGQRCGDTVFDSLSARGQTAAIAGYHWFYELLSGELFDPFRHRHATPPIKGVAGACWYFEDDYPDSHLLADAEALRVRHAPDLLMVHPMGPDHAGHQHGGESSAYMLRARVLDMQLARVLPRWHAAGYDVLLTSDHGMNADRMHGGTAPAEREVPLIWLPCAPHQAADAPDWPTGQLDLRRFVLDCVAPGPTRAGRRGGR